MAFLTIFNFSRVKKNKALSANLHVQRYMYFTLFVMTILLMNNKVNAQTGPTILVINASESDIYNSWNTTGLDGLCANAVRSDIPNVSAARPFTEQLQRLMPTNMAGINISTRRYIGARLYPELTQGWYWPGPNWSQESAALFYTTYNEGGETVNYSNEAENGLPPAGEAYGTRQAVVWNVTENGWITVDLRTEGEAQVICWLNAVYPTPYAGNETNNISNFLVPGSQIIIIVANEADVNEVFYTEGLDGLCQRNLPNDVNVSAVRIYTQQDEETFQQNLGGLNPSQRLYLGAYLYPQFTEGWYWAGPNWSPNGAVLFYTTYNEGGQTVMYSNWAPIDGLPPANETYGTRQAVSFNLTQNAWQAVALQTDGQAQVACMSMGPRPTATTTSTSKPHKTANDTVIIFTCIFVPLAFILLYIIASALYKTFYMHSRNNTRLSATYHNREPQSS